MDYVPEPYPGDAEILRLLAEGMPVRVLADRFGLPECRVQQLRQDAKQQKRVQDLQAQMRDADDIDRPWPVETVVAALNVDTRSHNCLERCLREDGRTEVTLKNVLDLLLPGDGGEAPVTDYGSGRRGRGIGIYIYGYLLRGIYCADLGRAFRREWKRKCLAHAQRNWGRDGLWWCVLMSMPMRLRRTPNFAQEPE